MKSSRIWILGGTSIIGWNVVRALPHAQPFCNPFKNLLACREWDRVKLEDRQAVQRLFASGAPELLIHCAGVCNVSKCEADPAWARAMNVVGMSHVLEALPAEARLVYVSSDHVFGHREGPCYESAEPSPISVYGRLRVEAEAMVLGRPNSLVLRAGLAVGASADGRSGHLDWLRYRHERQLPITIVRDEFRVITDAQRMARQIVEFAESATCGLRHLPGERFLSRSDLAASLCRRLEIDPPLKFVSRLDQPYPHIGRIELATEHS